MVFSWKVPSENTSYILRNKLPSILLSHYIIMLLVKYQDAFVLYASNTGLPFFPCEKNYLPGTLEKHNIFLQINTYGFI